MKEDRAAISHDILADLHARPYSATASTGLGQELVMREGSTSRRGDAVKRALMSERAGLKEIGGGNLT